MSPAAPALVYLVLLLGCSESTRNEDPAQARGRQVYLSLCTACHNADATKDGSAAPAVAGSSRELLEAKLMRGEYPPGYEPKRTSGIMPPFPQLEDEIDALAAFLAPAPAAP